MKKIRTGIFETNSSSSHSITIQKVGKYKPLVEDDILYPSRLKQYEVSLAMHDGGHVLKCDTTHTKAALVIHWLQAYIDHGEVTNDYLDYLIKELPYNKVVFEKDGNFKSDYYPYLEYDGDSLDLSSDFEKDKEVLDLWIERIFDDNIIIEDSEIPY